VIDSADETGRVWGVLKPVQITGARWSERGLFLPFSVESLSVDRKI